jgi:hypothetical protein
MHWTQTEGVDLIEQKLDGLLAESVELALLLSQREAELQGVQETLLFMKQQHENNILVYKVGGGPSSLFVQCMHQTRHSTPTAGSDNVHAVLWLAL